VREMCKRGVDLVNKKNTMVGEYGGLDASYFL